MHRELTRCLRIYRKQTPGSESAKAQLDRLAHPLRFHELQLEAAVAPQVHEFIVPAQRTPQPFEPPRDWLEKSIEETFWSNFFSNARQQQKEHI